MAANRLNSILNMKDLKDKEVKEDQPSQDKEENKDDKVEQQEEEKVQSWEGRKMQIKLFLIDELNLLNSIFPICLFI